MIKPIICIQKGRDEDDWIDEDGIRQIVIHLPYTEVKFSSDVCPMILMKATKRLGMGPSH